MGSRAKFAEPKGSPSLTKRKFYLNVPTFDQCQNFFLEKLDPGSGRILWEDPVGGHPKDHDATLRLLQVLSYSTFIYYNL